jgi:hypothetical protein
MNPTKQDNKPIIKQTKAMSKPSTHTHTHVYVCEETNSPHVQHKLSREKEMCVEKQTLRRYNTNSTHREMCLEKQSMQRYPKTLPRKIFV